MKLLPPSRLELSFSIAGSKRQRAFVISVVSMAFFASVAAAQEATRDAPLDTVHVEQEEKDGQTLEALDIKLEQASEYVDRHVRLKFRVASSKLIDQHKICFLNSEEDHREPSNVSVVIKTGEILDLFTAADIPDPAAHFYEKTIQVTGQIELHKDKPQILVTNVKQIKILNDDETSEVLGKSSNATAKPE